MTLRAGRTGQRKGNTMNTKSCGCKCYCEDTCPHTFTRDSGAVWEEPKEIQGASVFTCDDCGEDVFPVDCDHSSTTNGFCDRCGF